MRYLLSSIAIAALAAATVHADPGGGKGHAGGNGAQSEAPRGGGNGADKGERGNGKSGGNGNGEARGQAAAPQPNRAESERNVRGDQGRDGSHRQFPAQAQGETRGKNGNGKGNDFGRDDNRGEYAEASNLSGPICGLIWCCLASKIAWRLSCSILNNSARNKAASRSLVGFGRNKRRNGKSGERLMLIITFNQINKN